MPTSDYPSTWLGALGFEALHLAFATIMSLGASFRYRGTQNMPKTGPALVIANHQSFLDPLLVGLAAGRPLTYLARKTLFRNRTFAAIIRTLNAVPIDQEGVGKEGLRTVVEQLQQGGAVVVFPEGGRTIDGRMQELRPGIHLVIRRASVPIVPVGIAGAYHAWPIWRKYPIPAPLFLPATERTIAVVVGKPLDSQRFAELPRVQAMAELFAILKEMHEQAEKLRRK